MKCEVEINNSIATIKKYTFNKKERLKSRKKIQLLFRRKLFVQNEYIKIFYSFTEKINLSETHQFAFSAPKKNFSNASDRNYIKRLMREAVRKNKSDFTIKFTKRTGSFFITYINPQQFDFQTIDNSILELFKRIR